MPHTTLPIVGAFYRPPAQIILSSIPVGTKLGLLAEPDNEHDPNAIAVWIDPDEISDAARVSIEAALPETGLTWDDILNQGYWHLGYISRNFAAELKATRTVVNEEMFDVEFALSNDGKPRVKFPYPVL